MIFRLAMAPWMKYLIVTLVVVLSGIPPIYDGAYKDQVQLALFMFLGVLYFARKNSSVTLNDLVIFFCFLILFVVQSLDFNLLPLITVAGFFVRLFIALSAVRLVGNDFPRLYINVLYAIGIISLCFYFPDRLFAAVGFDLLDRFAGVQHFIASTFQQTGDAHILLYNFQFPKARFRNPAVFWEPGAFAGYLLLALVFLGLQKDRYEQRFYRSRLVLLVICLLTTVSTMAYLTLAPVLLIHYRNRNLEPAKMLGVISLGIFMLPLLFIATKKTWDVDFIGPKIEAQLQTAIQHSGYWNQWMQTRFGAMVFDWMYIKRRPLSGWGLNEKTLYALHPNEHIPRGIGNGFTGFLHRFGSVGMACFLFFTYRGFYILSGGGRLRSGIAIVAIIMTLQGEHFLNFPLYLGLMFINGVPLKKLVEADAPDDGASRVGSPVRNCGV